MARGVGKMVLRGALFLLIFHFETGANELVDLVASLKLALGELPINLVVRMSVPNESHDFYEQLAISSEPGIASFQDCDGGAADARVICTQPFIHIRFRQLA